MMFLNVKRNLSVAQFILIFGLFWVCLFIYVSTWESDLLTKLQREKLRAEEILKGNFAQLLVKVNQSSFVKEKDAKIKKYREMFNLTNPGAMGEPVVLPENIPENIKKIIDKGWRDYTINEFVSDLVPLRRPLPDIRGEYCLTRAYKNLSKASVIIIFHNEAWSMVLRTMHSVLDQSPDELLEEIIFVDDCSDRGWRFVLIIYFIA